MGLDFSHGDAHWAYGGFGRFREALAEHEGFDLTQMRGFAWPWDDRPHADLPWDDITTPLKPLLNHSDCDGELTSEECAQVAPRLREVIDALWPEDEENWINPSHRRNGLLLVEAMEYCAENNETLEFQ